MLIGMVGLPITMLLVPACTEFTELLLNLMLMGWCMGCIDCVANLRMILRFGTNVSPFLQVRFVFLLPKRNVFASFSNSFYCAPQNCLLYVVIYTNRIFFLQRSYSAITCAHLKTKFWVYLVFFLQSDFDNITGNAFLLWPGGIYKPYDCRPVHTRRGVFSASKWQSDLGYIRTDNEFQWRSGSYSSDGVQGATPQSLGERLLHSR